MKFRRVSVLCALFAGLLAGCGSLPVSIPLPFFGSPTPLPSAPEPAAPLETPTPTVTPLPTETPTPTPSITPWPTRKSPYPAALGTQVIDMGFAPIGVENVPNLIAVFSAQRGDLRHAAASRDGQKLFVTSANGLFVFNRLGEQLAHWPELTTFKMECDNCLSVNRDGSRFAFLARNAAQWEAQVYEIRGDAAVKILGLPVDAAFLNRANEGRIALSPDGMLLAYATSSTPLRVFDLASGLQVFTDEREAHDLEFTPDGAFFVVRQMRTLFFYNPADWGLPADLVLPNDDTPYSFAPDGSAVVLALNTRLRVFSLPDLKLTREASLPPGSIENRAWQMFFPDATTLRLYSQQLDSFGKTALVDTGEWNITNGESLRFETFATDDPQPLSSLWGAALTLTSSTGDLEPDAYNGFRFISDGMVLVNSQHSACWLKYLTAELTCFKDPEHVLFASDGVTFREILETYNTLLQTWGGETTLQISPYRITNLNRSGDWAFVDVRGLSADLYARGKTLPEESVAGVLQGFAENPTHMVFTTQQANKTFTLTIFEKASGASLFQVKMDYLYQPLALTRDGTVFFFERDLDKNLVILNRIAPSTFEISEVARLPLPSAPQVVAASANSGLLAIGLADGSVYVTTQDASAGAFFQGFGTIINGLSFSPDGRYLAVASPDGVKIFAAKP